MLGKLLHVDVVLCTFNGARYVGAQIESIFAQQRLPSKVIVGDDGSTDGTVEIVERLALDAPIPVEVVRNSEQLGPKRNFLGLACRSDADLVALCDQDDEWRPDKLARCIPEFDDPDVMVVNHAFSVIDENGELDAEQPPPGRTFRVPQHRKDPWLKSPGMAMVFRRRLLDWIDPDRTVHTNLVVPMLHDLMVQSVANALGDTVYVGEPLAAYRIHGDNAVFGQAVGWEDPATPEAQDAIVAAVEDWVDWMGEMAGMAECRRDLVARRDFLEEQRVVRRFAESLAHRRDLYAIDSRPKALATWAGGVVDLRYRSRSRGGLGIRGAARDLVTVAKGEGA